MRSPSTGVVEDFFSALFRTGRNGTSALAPVVEGLRMAQAFEHEPVMADEVVAAFGAVAPGVVVDGTVGAGGHAAAILAAHRHLGVLGLDRDPSAVAASLQRLQGFGARAKIRRAPFGAMGAEVAAASATPSGWPASGGRGHSVTGVLLDLGVSSPQLDRAERGFSYRRPARLDMRMDPSSALDAAQIVNNADVGELARMFAANGEVRLAGRIARAIVGARPIETTDELAAVVAAAVPAAVRRRGHPARRVFQALRITVNDELGQLATVLPVALELVAPGGRVAVISYHSGEDRLVKAAFAEAVAGGCTCPPGLPCVCGAEPEHRWVFRGARKPSAAEVERNRRAESARFRVVERLTDSGGDR